MERNRRCTGTAATARVKAVTLRFNQSTHVTKCSIGAGANVRPPKVSKMKIAVEAHNHLTECVQTRRTIQMK